MTADALRLELKEKPRRDIILDSCKVGVLADSMTSWPTDASIDLDGFQYQRLASEIPMRERLRWLRQATPAFSPQPYDQLASCFLMNGHENEARNVRVEATRRSYQSGNPGKRAWGALQDVILGFGYRPSRALFFFVILWIGAALWFLFGAGRCDRPGATTQALCPIRRDEHPTWDPWLYSLDLLIPVLDLGQEKSWDPTGLSKGVMYVLVFGGWILVTTILAAVSRALRRS